VDNIDDIEEKWKSWLFTLSQGDYLPFRRYYVQNNIGFHLRDSSYSKR
jgi:hypothetical protein